MKLVTPTLVIWISAVGAASAVSLRGDHERASASSLPALNGTIDSAGNSWYGPVSAESWADRKLHHRDDFAGLQTLSSSRRTAKMNHKIPEEELAIIDEYVITYWGIVFGCMAGIVWYRWYKDTTDTETPRVYLEEKSFEIPENMWSAYLIAGMGQMYWRHNGKEVPPSLVMAVSLIMGSLQVLTVFLIVHDIDPDAEPVTSVPASPWKKSTWTINCMKWLMVLFLVMGLIPEVSDCQEVIRAMLEVSPERIQVSRPSVWFVVGMHYTVTILVIWGGVNAVLSFAAVPDIVYSSLAITFLSHVDDISYQFFKRLSSVKAHFVVEYKAGERTMLPNWVEMALKMQLLVPTFWGMFLISRAYATNVMPAGRVRYLMAIFSHVLGL